MSIKEAPHVGGGVCSPGKAMHLSLEAEAGHGDARRCPGIPRRPGVVGPEAEAQGRTEIPGQSQDENPGLWTPGV